MTLSRVSPRRTFLAAAGGLAAAVAVAGCGGSGGYGASAPPPSTTAAVTVSTHNGTSGTYLTGAGARTLYVFSADKGTSSACSGGCAQEWRPVTTSTTPQAGGGVMASRLGTAARGATKQVTYAGHPLYYFAGDSAAGQTNGEGLEDFGGLWSTVTPAGTPMKAKTAPTKSPASGGYGNGYSY